MAPVRGASSKARSGRSCPGANGRCSRTLLLGILLAHGTLGCGGARESAPTPAGALPINEDIPASGCDRGKELVKLRTVDEIQLIGDLYSAGVQNGAAVVLLHMIPPENDRTNYPPAFIDGLLARNVTVLNLDRRGAGDSAGNPVDAYEGPKGKLDVKAAIDALIDHPCKVDPQSISLVGASNGTTSVVDYVAGVPAEELGPLPRRIVLLTGGDYTENQTDISALTELSSIETLFLFSTAEREWSSSFAQGAPTAWRFEEVEDGAHGTKMFQAKPETVDLLISFLSP